MTEEERDDLLAEACDAVIGSCMDSPYLNFARALGKDVLTDEEEAEVDKYLAEADIHTCDCCGWWTNDQAGVSGTLCWQCAQDEDEDEGGED